MQFFAIACIKTMATSKDYHQPDWLEGEQQAAVSANQNDYANQNHGISWSRDHKLTNQDPCSNGFYGGNGPDEDLPSDYPAGYENVWDGYESVDQTHYAYAGNDYGYFVDTRQRAESESSHTSDMSIDSVELDAEDSQSNHSDDTLCGDCTTSPAESSSSNNSAAAAAASEAMDNWVVVLPDSSPVDSENNRLNDWLDGCQTRGGGGTTALHSFCQGCGDNMLADNWEEVEMHQLCEKVLDAASFLSQLGNQLKLLLNQGGYQAGNQLKLLLNQGGYQLKLHLN